MKINSSKLLHLNFNFFIQVLIVFLMCMASFDVEFVLKDQPEMD